MKFTFRKKDLLTGVIIGGVYTILLFLDIVKGVRHIKYFDDFVWIITLSTFSIPFLIGVFLSNTIYIITVFLNSYLIAIAFNKLRSKKVSYSKWFIYGLSYIGINTLISFSAWYFYIFPTIYKGFYSFFRVILGNK
jgi:hypothetical protein